MSLKLLGDTMLRRIVYKTPHNIFFRRLWFAKTYKLTEDGLHWQVTHGVNGRLTTFVPVDGTIFRVVTRG